MSGKLVLVVITSILLVSLHGSTAFARIISNDEFLDSYGLEVSNSTAYVSVPFYYQNNNYYCGPAALEMVFDYYGEDISQTEIADVARTYPYVTYTDELRRAAHFSNLSTSLGDEMSGNITGYSARKIGCGAFEQGGLTIDDLKLLIDRKEPVIVLMWWTPSKNYGHYRVVVGYNETHIIMHDPWNKDAWGGVYGGANTSMTYSTFLDLWEYVGYWGLLVCPWDLDVQVPETVVEGGNFEVAANVTYTCPPPFDTGEYPASSCNATIKLTEGLKLGSGENAQHSLGSILAGNLVHTSWTINANETGSYNISVTVAGIVEGDVGAHGNYSSYNYEDAIGGSCTASLSITNQTRRVHNLNTGYNYTTIQEAINAPETLDDHTIYVEEGTYYEHVVVNKSVSLIGENKYNTVVDGNYTGNVIEVTASNVNVTGFTIQHGGNGIYLQHGGNGIYGNIVRNNTNGIYLTGFSSNNNVSYNIITNNRHGIVLSYSGKNTLLGNNATNNRYNFEVKGFAFSHLNNYVDTSNTADGKPIYYLIDVNNAIFGAESNAGTVFLINCQNITVKDLTLTKNGAGIFLWNTTNSKIENVTVTKSIYGVFLGDSCNNTLSANTVANCTYGISLEVSFWQNNNNMIIGNNVTSNSRGIDLDTSNNNIITDNIVTDNSNGIYLWDSSSNILFGNIVSSSKYGIELWAYGSYGNILSGNIVSSSRVDGIVLNGANNNTLSGNIVSSNGQYGITLMADNNIIYGNILINNSGSYWSSGIYFGWTRNNTISSNTIKNNSRGIFLYGEGENNQIFHNNFINNTDQVASSKEHSNIWDSGYPSGGNYWSDYNGTDADQDGIGDSPYVIDVNNQDNHPLMGMFSDFKATSEYHVQTICNSTVSDFQYNGTAILFDVSGENGTTGFCRMCIPRALMNETYRVFVNGTEVECNPLTEISNVTHNYVYFIYNHSVQEVVIIPEFSSFLILPLFMIATLLAVIVYKRKHQTRNKREKFSFVVSFYVWLL